MKPPLLHRGSEQAFTSLVLKVKQTTHSTNRKKHPTKLQSNKYISGERGPWSCFTSPYPELRWTYLSGSRTRPRWVVVERQQLPLRRWLWAAGSTACCHKPPLEPWSGHKSRSPGNRAKGYTAILLPRSKRANENQRRVNGGGELSNITQKLPKGPVFYN